MPTAGRDGATVFTTEQARVVINPNGSVDGVRPMISMSVEGGGRIGIAVFGYENTDATNDSDANWLSGRVTVAVGAFSGEFEAALTTQDFVHFERQLSEVLQTLRGEAAFQTAEDCLRFDIKMNARGAATVSGDAKASGGSEARLRFSFETDQSYLQQTQRALSEITRTFPIRDLRGR